MGHTGLLAALLRDDLNAFLHKVFCQLNPGSSFKPNWHLQAIAHRLEEVRAGDTQRLIVTVPPRSLKSISISVAWVAFMLGHDPTLKFVCVSYASDLALKHARDCRTIMESDWYRRLFPRAVLVRGAEGDLVTSLGGGRFSTSVGGVLTGRGGDIIIIDDPIKPGDANSDLMRENAWDWFCNTLQSRLDDKVTGRMVVVMQRLHADDLVGRLLEAGGWDHLNLPAIAETEAEIPIGFGRVHHRREGDVLHPERESRLVLDQLASTMGSAAFSAQYQQAPVPADGYLMKRDWIQRYGQLPGRRPGDRIYQSWDCANKVGSGNDYTVCVTALVRAGKAYVIDVSRGRLDFPTLYDSAVTMARDYQANVLLIEDAASGTQLLQMLDNRAPKGVPLAIAVKPQGDKVVRFSAACASIEAGGLILPQEAPWLSTYERELLAFPSTKNDDQVDATTQLLLHIASRPVVPTVAPYMGEGRSWDPALG